MTSCISPPSCILHGSILNPSISSSWLIRKKLDEIRSWMPSGRLRSILANNCDMLRCLKASTIWQTILPDGHQTSVLGASRTVSRWISFTSSCRTTSAAGPYKRPQRKWRAGSQPVRPCFVMLSTYSLHPNDLNFGV